MRKRNYIKISTRAEIVYSLANESLRDIIDMKIDYNDNDRENSCNGFKNPTRDEIVYLMMERQIIGTMMRFKMTFDSMLHLNMRIRNLRAIKMIVTNVKEYLVEAV